MQVIRKTRPDLHMGIILLAVNALCHMSCVNDVVEFGFEQLISGF